MPKPNIPIASRNWITNPQSHGRALRDSVSFEVKMRDYFRGEDVPHSIRTDIPTSELKLLELFRDANHLPSMRFGYYSKPNSRHNFISDNKVCYAYISPTDEEKQFMVVMKLKYGSFEKAYEYFKTTL